jgi:endonuclease YncB( thermonuclease family)
MSWSKLGGPMLAEGLANVYYPDRNRTVGDTFLRYGLDLASRAGGNMFREYWPILLKKMSHTSGPAAN